MAQPLANSELAVMNLLWDRDQRLTAREIRESLYPDESKPQHGTVQRLLQRLEEKGYIERDKSLSVHFFVPRITRDDYAGQQMELLADKLTSGSFAPLITHLFERKKISKQDVTRLGQLLEEYGEDHKSKNRKNKRSES